MSPKPIFKKRCENPNSRYCSVWPGVELVQSGDGYKQICPVCGWTHDPEAEMSVTEKNQYEMDNISVG